MPPPFFPSVFNANHVLKEPGFSTCVCVQLTTQGTCCHCTCPCSPFLPHISHKPEDCSGYFVRLRLIFCGAAICPVQSAASLVILRLDSGPGVAGLIHSLQSSPPALTQGFIYLPLRKLSRSLIASGIAKWQDF